MIKFLIIVILLAGFYLGAVKRGRRRWSAEVSSFVEQVVREAESAEAVADLTETETLPEPVKRYFRKAVGTGLPVISQAYLVQEGGFRSKPEVKKWSALWARQVFSAAPRAFVWDAKITMAPAVSVRVCDAYRNGSGLMKAALFSIVPLADIDGGEEIGQGALMRYLAESVWFPTALLPSQGVSWEPLDDRRAKARLTDGGRTVRLTFSFNSEDEIESVYAPDRYREVDGDFLPTPWEGRFHGYTDINGYRVPTEAEVAWHLPEGPFPYWRAMIKEIRYI